MFITNCHIRPFSLKNFVSLNVINRKYTFEVDLYIVKMYNLNKNEVSVSTASKVIA